MADKVMISFGKKYEKEYEHLMKKPKRSNYIAELIRRDRLEIEAERVEYELMELEQIKQALKSVIDEYDFSIKGGAQTEPDEVADYSDKINDLFNV